MRKLALFGALAVVTLPIAAWAQDATYRVEAESFVILTWEQCTFEDSVSFTGDGDTDLDFVITDSSGNIVHQDYGSTDRMSATLRNSSYPECRALKIKVENLGNVYNNFEWQSRETDVSIAARQARPQPRVDLEEHNRKYRRHNPEYRELIYELAERSMRAEADEEEAATLKSTDGKNRWVTIENLTGETIWYLKWSSINSDSWGRDRLGENQTIASGSSLRVQVDDGDNECEYDFKATTISKKDVSRRKVDVCSVSNVTFE